MKTIDFIEGKDLKYSRAYYELTVPNIVKNSVLSILTILIFIILYVIIAPYDVIIKADAQIRPNQDLVYITPIASGVIKEKLFKNGQKVFKDQVLYVLDNDYIMQELKTQNEKITEYQWYIQKDENILQFLNNYDNTVIEIESDEFYIHFIENQIKKLQTELEISKFKYESEQKLFPQSTSKFDLKKAENNYKFAEITLENYISETKTLYSEELKNNKLILSEIESNIAKLVLQIDQTVLKSTCDGYIEELYVTNIGESVIGETQIARIIPENNGKLKVYLNVTVQDIAELHRNDSFMLSFPKYPSSNFSSVSGFITNISKDSIFAETGLTFLFGNRFFE